MTSPDDNLLSSVLDEDELGEECLDFIEAHGYVTSSLISPVPTADQSLLEEVTGLQLHEIKPALQEKLLAGIAILKEDISRQLISGDTLELPCDIETGVPEQPSDIERWCMAFAEKHMLEADAWFGDEEEEVAAMLLPILCASEIIVDEDLAAMKRQKNLYINMLEDIPDLVMDLYAHFHSK